MILLLVALQTAAIEEPKEPPAKVQQAAAATGSAHPLMIIEPKARADDFVKAFDLLRKERPTARVLLQTYSGQTFSGVTDVSVLPNGTLVLLKLFGPAGQKYQIVPVDDLQDLTYAP